jgi:hypothetical protein
MKPVKTKYKPRQSNPGTNIAIIVGAALSVLILIFVLFRGKAKEEPALAQEAKPETKANAVIPEKRVEPALKSEPTETEQAFLAQKQRESAYLAEMATRPKPTFSVHQESVRQEPVPASVQAPAATVPSKPQSKRQTWCEDGQYAVKYSPGNILDHISVKGDLIVVRQENGDKPNPIFGRIIAGTTQVSIQTDYDPARNLWGEYIQWMARNGNELSWVRCTPNQNYLLKGNIEKKSDEYPEYAKELFSKMEAALACGEKIRTAEPEVIDDASVWGKDYQKIQGYWTLNGENVSIKGKLIVVKNGDSIRYGELDFWKTYNSDRGADLYIQSNIGYAGWKNRSGWCHLDFDTLETTSMDGRGKSRLVSANEQQYAEEYFQKAKAELAIAWTNAKRPIAWDGSWIAQYPNGRLESWNFKDAWIVVLSEENGILIDRFKIRSNMILMGKATESTVEPDPVYRFSRKGENHLGVSLFARQHGTLVTFDLKLKSKDLPRLAIETFDKLERQAIETKSIMDEIRNTVRK